jgi:hypothetical protein
MNKNVRIIQLSSVATCGKDLFFSIAKKILKKNGYNAMRFAYADPVKRDLDPFLIEKTGISAFTTNPEEKKLIRPFIVAYSTTLMRKINPNIWIEKTGAYLESLTSDIECFRVDTDILIGVDARFPNELHYVSNLFGQTIHLKKYTYDIASNKIYTPPANDEEAYYDPLNYEMTDIKIEWEDIGKSPIELIDNEYLNKIVFDTLNKLDYFSGKLSQ